MPKSVPALANDAAAIEAHMAAGTIKMSDALIAHIEKAWAVRSRNQRCCSDKTMAAHEVEFYVGAMAALTTQGFIPPPRWVVNIIAGVSPSAK